MLVECDPVEGFRHDGEVEAALPVAGMSCAVVEVPASTRVRVAGLGAIPAWSSDDYPDDTHYSIRLIRTTVSAGDTG